MIHIDAKTFLLFQRITQNNVVLKQKQAFLTCVEVTAFICKDFPLVICEKSESIRYPF